MLYHSNGKVTYNRKGKIHLCMMQYLQTCMTIVIFREMYSALSSFADTWSSRKMQKFTSTAANNWPENTTLSSLSKGNNKMPQIYENWWIISNNLYAITEKKCLKYQRIDKSKTLQKNTSKDKMSHRDSTFPMWCKKVIPKWISKLNAVIFKITTVYKRITKWSLDIKERTSSLKMKLEISPCWLRNTMRLEKFFSWLRALISLSEDLDSVPRIWRNRTICNSSSGGYIAILWSPSIHS